MSVSQKIMQPVAKVHLQRDLWLDWLLSIPALWIGTLLAIGSVTVGIRNSILHSLDFQWSPAHLLTQHVDPWAVYLAGDPTHRILLNQVPNYLHELYILMLPFGYLSFSSAKLIWAILNVLLILLSCALVARLYELSSRKAWLLTVLVLMGTPARVTIGNGQVTALILAVLALWACTRSVSGRGLLLGAAWAKYSLPPILAIWLLFRRRWRLLFFSLLSPMVGLIFFYAWLRTPFLSLLLAPFQVATTNVSPGLANVMALSGIALLHPPLFQAVPDAFYMASPATAAGYVPYLCAIASALLLAAYFYIQGKRIDGRLLLACLLAASLLCFKHQIYDFLFLIFALAIALRAPRSSARNAVLLGLAYFWYIERLLHIHRWEFWPAVVLLSFFILLGLIAATWKLRHSILWECELDL